MTNEEMWHHLYAITGTIPDGVPNCYEPHVSAMLRDLADQIDANSAYARAVVKFCTVAEIPDDGFVRHEARNPNALILVFDYARYDET